MVCHSYGRIEARASSTARRRNAAAATTLFPLPPRRVRQHELVLPELPRTLEVAFLQVHVRKQLVKLAQAQHRLQLARLVRVQVLNRKVPNKRVAEHLLAQRQVPVVPRTSPRPTLPRQTLRAPLCGREGLLESFRLFLGRRITRVLRAPRARLRLAPRRHGHDDTLQR
jgi:hypothetical protein